jgi:hypothetical protein
MGKHQRGDKYLYPIGVDALAEHLDIQGKIVWECAAGTGQMTEALKEAGAARASSDTVDRSYPLNEMIDFLPPRKPKLQQLRFDCDEPAGNRTRAAFIARGLARLSHGQTLTLLLSVDFCSGVTRRKYFHDRMVPGLSKQAAASRTKNAART